MADPSGHARARRPRGPRLPKSVGGLIEAMRAFGMGDPRPLNAWDQERLPILKQVLDAWARDADLGDRLAFRIVREALFALRAGREIHSELPWMAGVALRGRAEILTRERPIGDPLPDVVQGPAGEPIDELTRQEDCDRVRRVIASLPTTYRLALTLRYILGCTQAEVAAYFEERFRIRLEGTRWILKTGRELAKAGLEGRDPRVVFPDRYARDKKNRQKSAQKPTPPPPFQEHKR